MNFRVTLTGLLLILLFPFLADAQTSTLRGSLQDNDSKSPIAGATITIKGSILSAITDDKGSFTINSVPYGNYSLEVVATNFEVPVGTIFNVPVNGPNTEAGVMSMSHTAYPTTAVAEENIPSVTLSDSDLKDESSQGVSAALGASRDPFAYAANFNFSVARFRSRGYSNEQVTYMNGVPVEDLVSGRTLFNTWGGLNDVIRSRESTYGLSPSEDTYGSLDGATSIDCKASRQRKQFQISYAAGNTSYDNRVMATYGSGMMKGGWSFAGSISRRWAKEGYVKGTYYDGWSWFMSVEKKFGENNTLSLSQIGANTINGRSTAAVAEVYELSGTHYYNPNWGYQNGKIRNSSIGHQQQPLTILSHEWKIDKNSNLETSLGYQYGVSSTTGFDWLNSPNPNPTYYRNLPSFQEDSASAVAVANDWINNESIRQVNWDHIYDVNKNGASTTVADGNGGTVTGKLSAYILEERVSDNKRITFNTVKNTSVGEHLTYTNGFSYQYQQTEFYKRASDLLGGDFYLNLNQYAEQSFPGDLDALQNDLNTPNQVVHVGDKFGYDYIATLRKSMFWLQLQFKFNKIDFYVGGNVSNSTFTRTGLYKSGIFKDNSYGDSPKQAFNNYSVKGGLTYKLNGRNYLYANGLFETRAPLFENTFLSPKTQNTTIADIDNANITSIEGGYLMRAPKIKIRATVFYTQKNNETDVQSFYDDQFRTFVNYAISNIDTRYVGLELGTEVTLGKGFTANAAVSLGDYYFNSRQHEIITSDNSPTVLANNTIYSKNFYVSGSPQNSATVGINYRAKKFWYLGVNGNYFDKRYTDFNRSRRTVEGVALLTADDPRRAAIIEQEKLGSAFTLNLNGGKSWKVNNWIKSWKRQTFLVLNASINNVLNNTDFRTNGFEQLRFDFTDKNVNKYAPKYNYAYGATYFIGLTLRFN